MKPNTIIRLTREFDFEMAHALENYDGACRHIHGHSYRMFITVSGVPLESESDPKEGMVMDFGELKGLVNRLVVDRFDHTLLLRDNPENQLLSQQMRSKWGRIELTHYQPTCENLLIFIVEQLNDQLPAGVSLCEVKLYETARSYAQWKREDNN
ncbi:MAG: 6-carboxytetrahydropterin synthase [Rikenellaceae bacterium]